MHRNDERDKLSAKKHAPLSGPPTRSFFTIEESGAKGIDKRDMNYDIKHDVD